MYLGNGLFYCAGNLKYPPTMSIPTSSVASSTAGADGKTYTYRELQDLVTMVSSGLSLCELYMNGYYL